MTSIASAEPTALRLVRLSVLVIFVAGVVGTAAELYLLEHMEETLQWVPFVLLGSGSLALTVFLAHPTATTLALLRFVLALFVAGGVLGIILHYRGNVEFELEMYPTRGGFELFWESLRGATPALAPGTMIQLGLVGLVYTFRFPLRDRAAERASP